jgi:hypothetical protein
MDQKLRYVAIPDHTSASVAVKVMAQSIKHPRTSPTPTRRKNSPLVPKVPQAVRTPVSPVEIPPFWKSLVGTIYFSPQGLVLAVLALRADLHRGTSAHGQRMKSHDSHPKRTQSPRHYSGGPNRTGHPGIFLTCRPRYGHRTDTLCDPACVR